MSITRVLLEPGEPLPELEQTTERKAIYVTNNEVDSISAKSNKLSLLTLDETDEVESEPEELGALTSLDSDTMPDTAVYALTMPTGVNPIHISTLEEIKLLNLGVDESYPLDGYYILDNDIIYSLNDDNGIIDGTFPSNTTFTGVFDGNGHTIKNIRCRWGRQSSVSGSTSYISYSLIGHIQSVYNKATTLPEDEEYVNSFDVGCIKNTRFVNILSGKTDNSFNLTATGYNYAIQSYVLQNCEYSASINTDPTTNELNPYYRLNLSGTNNSFYLYGLTQSSYTLIVNCRQIYPIDINQSNVLKCAFMTVGAAQLNCLSAAYTYITGGYMDSYQIANSTPSSYWLVKSKTNMTSTNSKYSTLDDGAFKGHNVLGMKLTNLNTVKTDTFKTTNNSLVYSVPDYELNQWENTNGYPALKVFSRRNNPMLNDFSMRQSNTLLNLPNRELIEINSSYGNMSTAIYDKDVGGVVDNAETAKNLKYDSPLEYTITSLDDLTAAHEEIASIQNIVDVKFIIDKSISSAKTANSEIVIGKYNDKLLTNIRNFEIEVQTNNYYNSNYYANKWYIYAENLYLYYNNLDIGYFYLTKQNVPIEIYSNNCKIDGFKILLANGTSAFNIHTYNDSINAIYSINNINIKHNQNASLNRTIPYFICEGNIQLTFEQNMRFIRENSDADIINNAILVSNPDGTTTVKCQIPTMLALRSTDDTSKFIHEYLNLDEPLAFTIDSKEAIERFHNLMLTIDRDVDVKLLITVTSSTVSGSIIGRIGEEDNYKYFPNIRNMEIEIAKGNSIYQFKIFAKNLYMWSNEEIDNVENTSRKSITTDLNLFCDNCRLRHLRFNYSKNNYLYLNSYNTDNLATYTLDDLYITTTHSTSTARKTTEPQVICNGDVNVTFGDNILFNDNYNSPTISLISNPNGITIVNGELPTKRLYPEGETGIGFINKQAVSAQSANNLKYDNPLTYTITSKDDITAFHKEISEISNIVDVKLIITATISDYVIGLYDSKYLTNIRNIEVEINKNSTTHGNLTIYGDNVYLHTSDEVWDEGKGEFGTRASSISIYSNKCRVDKIKMTRASGYSGFNFYPYPNNMTSNCYVDNIIFKDYNTTARTVPWINCGDNVNITMGNNLQWFKSDGTTASTLASSIISNQTGITIFRGELSPRTLFPNGESGIAFVDGKIYTAAEE